MPLREDILTPIPGANGAGENLRYAPVYDKIKEARRQDDDVPQGDWQSARKAADWRTVIKLASEAIATKSKDLQLAVWLTEALLNTEGYAGLNTGLGLIRGLIDNFWEGLYPELEDGEAEFRAAPLDWLGGPYLNVTLKKVPLLKSGFTMLTYFDAKKVGYEADSAEDYERKAAYDTAIAEGKVSMDDWDKAVLATPKASLKQLNADVQACLDAIEELQPICELKFGEFTPSFSKLRGGIEEVQRLAGQVLDKKLEVDPDEAPAPVEEEPVEEAVAEEDVESAPAAPVKKKAAAKGSLAADPVDADDAIARVAGAAKFLRAANAYDPAPYLLLRGLRWGELRASNPPDPSVFEAPPTETRQALKRLLTEGSYDEVIELGEQAMSTGAGRAWLDLQRYVVTACEYQGYSAVAEAIKSEIKTLVRDMPDLLTATLLDDTPTANGDTQEWIKTFAGESPAAEQTQQWTAPVYDGEPAQSSDEEKVPDTFELATEAARAGRYQEAIELLTGEIGRQNSGRGRFQRKLQLAQICLSIGQEAIASSILQELSATIDQHQLESWESPEVVAQALAMLLGCMQHAGVDEQERRVVYARICRLDPVQAMRCASAAGAR